MQVPDGLRLFHGELEAPRRRGLHHHGPAEAVSCWRPWTPWSGTRSACAFLGDLTRHLTGAAGAGRRERTRFPRISEGFQANVCLNYGGRDEILRAARALCTRTARTGRPTPEALTEAGFCHYLYSAGIPDPELIIRPSGEQRLTQLPAVAVRLCGVLFLRHPLAGLRRAGAGQRHHRLPEAATGGSAA